LCYNYSTNIGTEYFKHGIYSPFFSFSKCSLFHNSNVFGSCIIHILYIGVLKSYNVVTPLTPNDHYSSCTASLTSKSCILYIYSTNIGTEYFKPWYILSFFSFSKCSLFHNSNVFGSCIIHILYTGVLKFKKKIIPAPKG